MDRLTDLLEICKDILESLKKSDPNRDHIPKEADISYFKNVISLEEGSDIRWRSELRKISKLFSNFFYDKSEFLKIFDHFVNYIIEERELSIQCKINSLLLLLVSCILNYKTSQTVFQLCPDIAMSITMDILENFFEEDDFIIEKLLLAKRLENDHLVGRKCSRLLRESSSNFHIHSQVNRAIEIKETSSLNTIYNRLRILSRLSDVLKLNNLRNLVIYSIYEESGKNNEMNEIHNLKGLSHVDIFKDICELSKNILTHRKVYLKSSTRHIEVRFNDSIYHKFLSRNLIKTRHFISRFRRTRHMNTWLHSSEDHYSYLDETLEDYVVVKNSEETLSKLLFMVDISRIVVVYGETKKFYISLLSKLLRIEENKITNVYTDDSTDIKSLVGNWVCTEVIGNFKFSYGVLARSMHEGRWLIFDSYLSNSIYNFLVDVCESGSLFIKELNQTIYAHENFQIFILRSAHPRLSNKTNLTESNNNNNKIYSNIGIEESELIDNDQVPRVFIEPPTKEDIIKICTTLYPNDKVAEIISFVFNLKDNIQNGFEISLIKLIKFINRIWPYLEHMRSISFNGKNNQKGSNYHIPENLKRLIMFDLYNIFVANLNMMDTRIEITNKLGELFNVHFDNLEGIFSSFELLGSLLTNGLNAHTTNNQNQSSMIVEGIGTRDELNVPKQWFQNVSEFSGYNSHVLRMIYSSFIRNEPVLLAGETGTGKTAIIQKFAEITGNQLKVFVFSDNSDPSDLIGSYYPVEYEDQNTEFMDLEPTEEHNNLKRKTQIRFQFNEGILIQCIRKGYWLLLDEINLAQQDLLSKLYSLLNHVYNKKTRTNSYFSGYSDDKNQKRTLELYEYIDQEVEINENFRLFACMNPPIIRKNDSFQFNTGKKELPMNFSKIFTTIYVDPISKYDDLLNVAHYYTRNITKQINFRDLCEFYLKIKDLSDKCEIQDGSYKLPNFTLRNFVRSIQYIINSITREYKPITNIEKVVFDSIYANFICTLANNSVEKALSLLPPHLLIHNVNDKKNLSSQNGISKVITHSSKQTESSLKEYTHSNCGRYVKIFDYWIRMGDSNLKGEGKMVQTNQTIPPFQSSNQEFVLCNNNSKYLLSLARIVSAMRVPILLQGPTAAGKTSLVKYLCEITNHTCVRINNHQHTDITEYIGQFHYRGDRMVFQYGTLVVAMKYGYWVILDELNLASSEILECLNRILDDNREIYISETNEVIKCHEDFMIFATQNPCDSIYGGRNQLSSSFTNRFIQIFFDDISNDDLKVIIQNRCKIPVSKSEIVVDIYDKIRQLTINSMLFQKNQILITTRDLIKLSNRIKNDLYKEYLFVSYYALIAEKLNNVKEKEMILDVLNKHFYQSHNKSKNHDKSNSYNLNGHSSNQKNIDDSLTTSDHNKDKKRKINQGYTISDVEHEYVELLRNNSEFDLNILKDFFTQNNYYWIDGFTDRIVYLVFQAILHREHVLLVGDTGIGKTTIIQVLAKFLKNNLNILNCNHNTESADFIGSLTPCNHADHNNNENELYPECPSPFKWVDGPVITSMIKGEWFLMDEISLAEDAVLEKLNSILEFDSYIILNNSYSTKNNDTELNNSEKTSGYKHLEEMSQIRCVLSHENFRLFATMNPGNDFGKKELSPSLSNRFTQIYVPPIPFTDLKILLNIISLHNPNKVVETWFVNSIKEILDFILSNSNLENENNITIRNVIILSNYYFKKIEDFDFNERSSGDNVLVKINSFLEGLEISILNSYKTKPINQTIIYSIINKFFPLKDYEASLYTTNMDFHLNTTLSKCNDKVNFISVLLEGNPGVGKTYNVYKLAKSLKKKLVRINLNEYTDLSDLIGTYFPYTNEVEESHKENKTGFKWINGPLIECMVNGDWIMFDELNLASSEILEGLNSILDHRRELYIPQINKTINCHPEFRLFATQNPVTTTNYRKNLPKSFLNRFIKVVVNDLKYQDFHTILEHKFPNLRQYFEKYIKFVNHFNIYNRSDSPFNSYNNNYRHQWNIRDLINIFELINSCDEQSAVNIIIMNRLFMSIENNQNISNVNSIVEYIKDRFEILLTNYYPSQFFKYVIKNNKINFNRDYLQYLNQLDTYNNLIILHKMKFPILIIYDKTIECPTQIISSFHRLIQRKSDKTKKLKTISIYENSDINDVVGGYEQVNYKFFLNSIIETFEQVDSLLSNDKHLGHTYQKLKLDHLTQETNINYIKLLYVNLLKHEIFKTYLSDKRHSLIKMKISELLKNIELYQSLMKNDHYNINKLEGNNENINFKWVDSDIIKSVEQGNWLLIKDVHMISSSLIDRLNSLLEPQRTININECGYSRKIKANKDFRIFFTANKEHLDKLSNAFVNRCIQLDVNSYKFIHNSNHIILDDIIECFLSKNKQFYQYKSKLNFKMNELYNVINSISKLNEKYMDMKYKKDLTIMALLFLFMNSIFNLGSKFILYLSKCYEFQHDLKTSFLMSLEYYDDHSINIVEARYIGIKIVETLYELQCNELALLYNSIGNLLNNSLQNNISELVLNMVNSYVNIYNDKDIPLLWYYNIYKTLKVEIKNIEQSCSNDYQLFKSLFFNQDRDMDINNIKMFLLLTRQTPEFKQLINNFQSSNIFVIRNLDSLFFYKFLEYFNNNPNSRTNISLFSMYIIQKLFNELEYSKSDQTVDFNAVDDYNIEFKTVNDKRSIVNQEQTYMNTQNSISCIYNTSNCYEINLHIFYLEKFIMKRIVFAAGLLFHKYLVGDKSITVLKNYISNISDLCDKCLYNIGDFLKQSIIKICTNISLYYESEINKESYVYRILFDVYDLFNHYACNNANSSNSNDLVNYLEFILFGNYRNKTHEINHIEKDHNMSSIIEDWDLVFYIINMDKTNNLNNLKENINNLKTIEYLNRFIYNENIIAFQFVHILHNIEYISSITRLVGFNIDLQSIIKYIYISINSFEKLRDHLNSLNININELYSFVNNFSNVNINQNNNKAIVNLVNVAFNVINELINMCIKIQQGTLDKRSISISNLFNNLIHFSLMIIPEVNNYISKLENEFKNQFRIYEIDSFKKVYRSFNILDSITFGYALNNEYILNHIKSLSHEIAVNSVGIDTIKELENNFPIIIDFINEYNHFKEKYLKLSEFETFDIYNIDETKVEAISNFLKHIRIKYYKINSIIEYPLFTIQSIIFNYRLIKLYKNRKQAIEQTGEFKYHFNINIKNKNIVEFTKILMLNYKHDKSQFVKLVELYLFHLVNYKRNFNDHSISNIRFQNYIITLILNYIKNTKKTIKNDSNYRIEYRLNKLQKQLLNKISEIEEDSELEDKDSVEAIESGIIFNNDLIVKSLINEHDFVAKNKFELERLNILSCVHLKMFLNQQINHKYNNLVQMSFLHQFIQDCSYEPLIFENEKPLISELQMIIDDIKNDLSLLMINYEEYPIVAETHSFIDNLTNINIKRVIKDWNITSYLQNLKNKLEKLVCLSKDVQGTNFKKHLIVVEQISEQYNNSKINYLRTYNQVVLDNHKIVLFNNLFIDLMMIFESYISNGMNNDKQIQLNETKDEILSYLFNNNILNMLLLRPVMNTIKLIILESDIKRQLIQLCEYVICLTKDYQKEVDNYIEELNKDYNENVKSYNNINEANLKKLTTKYYEGLKINFINLYTSKLLTTNWNNKNEIEVKGELSLMISNNYEYIVNNSKELNQLQYKRLVLSIIEQLTNMDVFKYDNNITNKKNMEIQHLLNYNHFEIVDENKIDQFYNEFDSCFNEYNDYINRSLNYLFRTLNILFKIGYIKTNYSDKKEEFNIDLFDKIVNKKTLIVIYHIFNTVYNKVMNQIQKFKQHKLNLVYTEINKKENKTIKLKNFRKVINLITELECAIYQQISSTKYGLVLQCNEKTNKYRLDNITEINNTLKLTEDLNKYLKRSYEYTYMDYPTVEYENTEFPIRLDWLDNIVNYLEQIECCLNKMTNNVLYSNSIKIIRNAKSILNHEYNYNKSDIFNDNEVECDNLELEEHRFDIEGHKMIELCEFVHEFVKFIELFIHIKPKNDDESSVQEGTEYIGGVGLDEGEGIKNISKEVGQDELNLEEMTNKQENQGRNQLSEEGNIDFDFNDDNEEINPEDIKDEEMDEHNDLENDEMEDDYSIDKKQQDDDTLDIDLECNEQVNLEHGEDYDTEVNQQNTDQIEPTNDDLDGYTESEFKDDQLYNQKEEDLANEEEEFLKKLEEDLENEEMKSEVEEQLESDGEIDFDNEETLEQEPYDIEDDENELENEDLDQESKLNKMDMMTQEAAELNLMVVSGLFNNTKRTIESDNLYGVPNNRFDNVINDLEQFNLNNLQPSYDNSNNIDSTETPNYTDRYQPGEYNVEEKENESEDLTNEFKNKKMEQRELKVIKQSKLNRETKESDLYEFHNESQGGESMQGLSNTNIDDFKELEDDHEMNVDNEENKNHELIDDIKNENEKISKEYEIQESEMDLDKDYETDLKEENDKIYINNELLMNNQQFKLEQIDYLKQDVADKEFLLDLDQSDINDLSHLSNNLMNHLRMILQYNQINSLKGYYKHGKRISIKKLMVFIATNYQKDKIWLKRLKPTKRNYYIQIAIDNTKSMSKISKIAVQTILIIYEAINKLNVGTLNIIKFGAYKPEIILNNNHLNYKRSWMSKLTFDEESKDSYENGLIYLFQFILSQSDFIASKNKILIIIADGKFNKNKARKYIINTINNNVVPLLVVLDPLNNITTMKHIINKDGNVVIENYLDNFPFPYYSIINNINKLPNILSDLLR